jgi:hypothetical protein
MTMIGIDLNETHSQYMREAILRQEIATLRGEVGRLTDILRSNGFQPCDISECNCGSWHHVGGFAARFREIEEATDNEWRNGETLLSRIQRIMGQLQALRGEGE